MQDRSPLSLALVAFLAVVGGRASPQETSQATPNEVVGRWALVANLTGGVDVTKSGVTQNGPVSHYDFKADLTFGTLSVNCKYKRNESRDCAQIAHS